jgi:hypothetical protein
MSVLSHIRRRGIALALCCLLPLAVGAGPARYERGTTILKPDRVQPGYTLCNVPARDDVSLIAHDGQVVHRWLHVDGLPMDTTPIPLDNGHLLVRYERPWLEGKARTLAELDWNGNVVWEFDDPDYQYMHHDHRPLPNGNVLVLAYRMRSAPEIADYPVKDDIIFEVTREGEVVWEWSTVDHFEQLGFDRKARAAIRNEETFPYNLKRGDVFHANSIQPLPENKWFDNGRTKFKPGNILVSQRNTNIIFIIDRETGDIVWKMGPRNGVTIGQHDPNMIPKGFPGAGNILVFDNGGRGGYPPERYRPYSRVLEINPVNRRVVWSYDGESSGAPRASLFSEFTSNARRLENGNTLITDSTWGRIVEVARDGTVLWEWLSPWVYQPYKRLRLKVPRCYRVPPEWPAGPLTGSEQGG